MKFSERLLKQCLIHDIEIYPNFFSNILKIPNQNKLFIVIIWDKVIPDYIYKETKNALSEYKIKFISPSDISEYLLKYKPWLIGYNSFNFDDVLMKALIKKHDSKKLLKLLYSITEWAINEKGSKYQYSKYKYDECIRGIDLMRVSGLDRIFKPLKQSAANLRHEKIQDLPIKPGSIVKENEIVDIITYELNDVLITEKLLIGIPKHHNSPTVPKTAYNGLLEAIDFRSQIGPKYKIDILNSNKSQIGEKMAAKLYSNVSGRNFKDFKSQQTNRKIIHYSDVIFDEVEFKTSQLKDFLENLKSVIYNIEEFESLKGKERIKYKEDAGIFVNLNLFDCNIDFKQGGIHFVPNDLKKIIPKDDEELLEADASSYYPMLYKNFKIEPAHLPGFSDFVEDALNTRLKYKKEGLKVFANGIKIPLNRAYGGFGDNHGWLKDIMALLKTTINGQLFLLMLTETCWLNGITPTVGNTDGIFFIVPNNKRKLFDQILIDWELQTRMIISPEKYLGFYLRDVNNYISITEKKLKLKGAYEYTGYLEKYGEFDLTGSFNNPIVPYAVVQYFTKQIPIKETILNHIKNYPYDGIYDFCTAKKVSKQFTNTLFKLKEGDVKIEKLQQSIRYYVSNSKDKLYKVKNKTEWELLSLLKNSKNNVNSYIITHDNLPEYKNIGYIENKGYVYVIEQAIFLKPLKKEWMHYDEVESGRNITLFNDYFKSDDYNVDYSYYLKEAQKLIDAIESKAVTKNNNDQQLKLKL